MQNQLCRLQPRIKNTAQCVQQQSAPRHQILFLITRLIPADVRNILGLSKFFSSFFLIEERWNREGHKKQFSQVWGNQREKTQGTESEKCVGLSAWVGCLGRHRREFIMRDKLYCSGIPFFFVCELCVCVCVATLAGCKHIHKIQ